MNNKLGSWEPSEAAKKIRANTADNLYKKKFNFNDGQLHNWYKEMADKAPLTEFTLVGHKTAFEIGFVKSAIAKGYTQPEAEAILKEAARGDQFKNMYPDFRGNIPVRNGDKKDVHHKSELLKEQRAFDKHKTPPKGSSPHTPSFEVLPKSHDLPYGVKKVKDVKAPIGKQIVQHLLNHKLPYGIGVGVGLLGAGAYALHKNKDNEKTAARGDFAKKFLPEFNTREPGHGIFNSLSEMYKGSPVATSVANNLRSKKMELGNPLVSKEASRGDFGREFLNRVMSNPSVTQIAHTTPSPRSVIGGTQSSLESLHQQANGLHNRLNNSFNRNQIFPKNNQAPQDASVLRSLRHINQSFRN